LLLKHKGDIRRQPRKIQIILSQSRFPSSPKNEDFFQHPALSNERKSMHSCFNLDSNRISSLEILEGYPSKNRGCQDGDPRDIKVGKKKEAGRGIDINGIFQPRPALFLK
jgi:hypothetical protein